MSFVLKTGATGPLIKELQNRLIAQKALPATDATGQDNQDGRFGQITRDAVVKYQGENGLPPDGVVGEATAKSLGLAPPSPTTLPLAGHILTETQLRKLAEAVDALIPTGPVDFFDDDAIAWLVKKLEGTLAELLPPKIAGYLRDLSQGLEIGDLGTLKKRLTVAINQRINVPMLSEETEAKIIAFFVDVVADSLRLGRTFEGSLGRLLPRFA